MQIQHCFCLPESRTLLLVTHKPHLRQVAPSSTGLAPVWTHMSDSRGSTNSGTFMADAFSFRLFLFSFIVLCFLRLCFRTGKLPSASSLDLVAGFLSGDSEGELRFDRNSLDVFAGSFCGDKKGKVSSSKGKLSSRDSQNFSAGFSAGSSGPATCEPLAITTSLCRLRFVFLRCRFGGASPSSPASSSKTSGL